VGSIPCLTRSGADMMALGDRISAAVWWPFIRDEDLDLER
jgi:hypothetical protein